MARTEPGEIKRQLPADAARSSPSRSTRSSRDLDRDHRARPVALAAPAASSATSPATARSPACSATTSAPASACSGSRWQSSPALTEVEEVVTDWMRRMLGLSDAWSGVIQDTASTSTLVALICARERATELRLEPRRAAGGAAAARRLHLGAQPQLGRQGGAARRLRPRQRPRRRRTTSTTRCAPTRWPTAIARRPARRRASRAPSSPPSGTHGLHRARSDRRDRARRARSTGSGCTSMRRWPARR